jgi:hypothetical protein
MRFRPANIRLINRRSNLPRLLLALSSTNGKSKGNDKNNPTDVQGLTGHSISDLYARQPNTLWASSGWAAYSAYAPIDDLTRED